MQDDYVTLNELSLDGFWGASFDVWNNLGGNLSTVFVRSIMLWDSRYSTNFYGLRMFPILTFFVVAVGVRSLGALCNLNISRANVAISSFILVVGMEGIFTPGILGVLNFSAASLVHFWPICLLPSIIYFLRNKSVLRSLFGFFLLLLASNANITESVLYVTVFFFLVLITRGRSLNWLLGLVISVSNVFIIMIAPGFGRRRDLFSQEQDLWQFPILFFKNFSIFSVDLLTHPMFYILFISGFSLSSMAGIQMRNAHFFRLVLFASMYLLLTTVGSSFAYPAWHQNLGLIPVFSLLSLQLGIRFKTKIQPLDSKILIFLYVVVICSILTRVAIQVENRAFAWDLNLKATIQGSTSVEIEAAEIIYPLFGLGIEDIKTWKWMAEPYSEWVRNFGARIYN